MNRAKKRFDRMTVAELREATKEFDRELPAGPDGLPGRALTGAQRRQWSKVRKKMGRPKIGRGAKTISLSVERELLKQADAYARRHGISRAKLVARGLQTILGSAA
jgi:hypothetical protein